MAPRIIEAGAFAAPSRPTVIAANAELIDSLRCEALHYMQQRPQLGGLLFCAMQVITQQSEIIDRHYGNGEIDPGTDRPPLPAKRPAAAAGGKRAPKGSGAQRPAAAAGGKRAPKGSGAHRHTFAADGKCSGCGAQRQRAPKGAAALPVDNSPEARTVPLPGVGAGVARRPIGDHRDDPFDGGTMGSSSAGDRR